MIQLFLHLIGDYIIQNDWMVLNKKKRSITGWLACQIHCLTYSLPFLFIGSWAAVSAIYISHYILDRTNIVAWFIAMKNGVSDIDNFGYSYERPFSISIWLLIITDNIFHLIFNYLSLFYL